MKAYKPFLIFLIVLVTVLSASGVICYQEYWNTSESCGAVGGGNVLTAELGVWTNVENTYDGDYDTEGHGDASSAFLYVNYSYPKDVLIHNIIWQVKDGLALTNLSIPETCIEYSEEFLELRYTSYGVDTGVRWLCFNESNEWELLRYQGASTAVYEEGVFWNISILSLDDCTANTIPAFNLTINDETTGSIIYGNLSGSIDYWNNISQNYTFLDNRKDQNNFIYCQADDVYNFTGNIELSTSSAGYYSRSFNRYYADLQGVYTAYLIPVTEDVAQITFIILDSSGARLEGADFRIFREVNGSRTEIYRALSDVAGQVVTYLDQTLIYDFEIYAPGFPDKTFTLQPALTQYNIILSPSDTSALPTEYQGLRYRITPASNSFNISPEWQNVTFEVEGSDLIYWGLNLTGHGFDCVPASCAVTGTTSTGGRASVAINLSTPGRFYTSAWFQKTGQTITYVNNYPNYASQAVIATRSILNLLSSVKDNTTPLMRVFMVAMLSIAIVGVGSFLGIAGGGLIILAGFANVFFSLPMIHLIDPLTGLLISIFSFVTGGFLLWLQTR